MQAIAHNDPLNAIRQIKDGLAFDAAIFDMHMPDMDGLELTLLLRGREETARLPVILLSSIGSSADHDSDRLEIAKVDAVLSKPVKPSPIVNALLTAFMGQPIRVDGMGREREKSVYDETLAEEMPLRILLADDHPTNQKLGLLVLKRLGYRADVAGNGLEVIEALRRKPYDIILMDIEMPEMDGVQATEQIHKDWPRDEWPTIVAVTANAMKGDRERFLAAGMDGYVSKPIRVEALVEALKLAAPDRKDPGPAQPDPAAPANGFDPNALRQLLDVVGGDPASLKQLIDSYIEETPTLIESLKSAATAQDVDKVRRAAHTLKSSSRDFGLHDLSALGAKIEASARDGTITATPDTLTQIETLYRDGAASLGAFETSQP